MRKNRYQRIDAHTSRHQNNLFDFIDIYTRRRPYKATSCTNDDLFVEDLILRFPEPLSRWIRGFLNGEFEVSWSLGSGFALVGRCGSYSESTCFFERRDEDI
jgi:hypothetical protein